jgi:dTDP-4-amino-4,6-dideoxygalactose transaminase
MRKPDLFVPAFTTLSPGMLLRRPRRRPPHPFSSSSVRYFYFARNALWRLVKILRLEGREVLLPAYHHGVEVEALLDAGARVSFYRIGRRMEVDLDDVERRIGPATRALHLTHFAGFPGPAREMKEMARRRGLYLIEDCAHALLTLDAGEPLGRTGDAAIFCLYKGLPVPNGGALVINNAELPNVPEPRPAPLASTFSLMASSLLRRLALRGGRPGRAARRLALRLGKGTLRASGVSPVLTGSEHFSRDHLDLGMSSVSLRIALSQDFDRIRAAQRRNYLCLLEGLRDVSEPLFPRLAPGVAPFFYPLVVGDNRLAARRLNAMGIEAVDFWRGSHPLCDLSEFPEVAHLRRSILEIPCHQDIPLSILRRVVTILRDTAGEGRGRAATSWPTAEPGRELPAADLPPAESGA